MKSLAWWDTAVPLGQLAFLPGSQAPESVLLHLGRWILDQKHLFESLFFSSENVSGKKWGADCTRGLQTWKHDKHENDLPYEEPERAWFSQVFIVHYLHKGYATCIVESWPGSIFSHSSPEPVRIWAGVEVLWDKQSAAPLENSLNLQVETLQLAKRSCRDNISLSGGAFVSAKGFVIGNSCPLPVLPAPFPSHTHTHTLASLSAIPDSFLSWYAPLSSHIEPLSLLTPLLPDLFLGSLLSQHLEWLTPAITHFWALSRERVGSSLKDTKLQAMSCFNINGSCHSHPLSLSPFLPQSPTLCLSISLHPIFLLVPPAFLWASHTSGSAVSGRRELCHSFFPEKD